MKVWATFQYICTCHEPDKLQKRAILATKTKKEAREIFDVGVYVFDNWYSQTGNFEEIDVATSNPGKIFTESREDFSNYVLCACKE